MTANREAIAAAHEESPNCWCKPRLNYRDQITGVEHWVHRSDDELEKN
jgi:hypothetical protein